jgi:NADPH:quinone reductase-like Zn-dependent oxidoreductase
MASMRAVAIDKFGGTEVLSVKDLPVPEPGPDQVLIRVDSAGVGIWDVGEREGRVAKMLGIVPEFPWVLGSEGAGKISVVGEKVSGLRNGDLVDGGVWGTNPKRGFYAEYTALSADHVWPIPSSITTKQAGALVIDGGTALRGLDDALALRPDEKLMIFGASGGIGHLAVQLARRLGARVFAVASGEDGVALAQKLGAEAAIDGHDRRMVDSIREFAPSGFDAALVTVAGEAPEKALTMMREGGRVAYPWVNQRPAPKAPSSVRLHGYNENMDRNLITKLNKIVEAGPFEVHLGKTFTLDQVAEAHDSLDSHHLGRLALIP